MWVPVKTVLWITLSITGVEDNGQKNYLFEDCGPYPVARTHAISISTDSATPEFDDVRAWFKQCRRAVLEMECSSVFTLDGDENKPRHGDWGRSRKAYICNAFKITVDGKTYGGLKWQNQ